MAQETVAIKIEVDAGKSVNEVKQLEQEISGLIDETNELKETNLQFKRELQELTQTYNKLPKTALASRKQLSEQMDELKIAINDNNLALQEFSIKKQQKQKLINDLKDVSIESKTIAEDLGNIAEGMAGGYQAFLGVSALLGVENDKLMATLVKLEGIQATLSAVEKIRNDLKKESEFLTSLNNTKTKIAIGLQKAYAVAVGTGSKAMQGFRKALLATGLGALVVGLGMVIAYWDDLKASIFGASEESEEYKKVQDDINNVSVETQVNLAKEKGNLSLLVNEIKNAKNGTEDRQKAIDKLNDKYKVNLENVTDETAFLKNLDVQQKNIIDNIQNKLQLMEAEQKFAIATEQAVKLELEQAELRNKMADAWGQNAFTEFLQGFTEYENTKGVLADQFKANEKILDLLDRTKKQAISKITDLNKTRSEYDNAEEEILEKRAKRERSRQNAINKRLEKEKSYNAESLALKRELEDVIISMEQDEDVRALAQLEVKQQRELDALVKKYGKNTELQKNLEKKQALEMEALINQIEADAKLKNDEKIKTEAEELANLKKEIADAEVNTLEEQRAKEFEDLDTYYNDLIQKAKDNKQSTLELEQTYLEKTKELKDKNAEEDKARAEEETAIALANIKAQQQARDMLVNDIGKGLDMLTFFMKDNEKKQKASALVQIATDTALAISSLVAQSQANALNGVTMGVAGAIQFANGIIQITTNMAKAKQLLSGGSGVTAPSTSVGNNSSMTSAVNNTTTSTGTNNGQSFNPFSGNNNSNRVVLVESELEAMQERRMTTQRIATI